MSRRAPSQRGERKFWKRPPIGLVLLTLLAAAIFPMRALKSIYADLDQFSIHAQLGDVPRMQSDLDLLQKDYDRLDAWKMAWVVNKRLFKTHACREGARQYLIGEYAKVITNMTGIEERCAHFLTGISHFQQQRARYLLGDRAAALDATINQTSKIFERALDVAKPRPNQKDVYNYDLTTDPGKANAALQGKGPPSKYRLGPEPDGKKPGGEKELEQGPKGGTGMPRRKG